MEVNSTTSALAGSDPPLHSKNGPFGPLSPFCEGPYPGLKILSEEARAARKRGGVQLLLVSYFPLLFGRPLCNCKHYEAPAG
jgi:hypothetical protein